MFIVLRILIVCLQFLISLVKLFKTRMRILNGICICFLGDVRGMIYIKLSMFCKLKIECWPLENFPFSTHGNFKVAGLYWWDPLIGQPKDEAVFIARLIIWTEQNFTGNADQLPYLGRSGEGTSSHVVSGAYEGAGGALVREGCLSDWPRGPSHRWGGRHVAHRSHSRTPCASWWPVRTQQIIFFIARI